MRPFLITIARLSAWCDELALKSWPDRPAIKRVRIRFARTRTRLIVGAIMGLVIGSLAAMAGIRLSGLDTGGAVTSREMAAMVVTYAVGGAAVGAFAFDLTYYYIRSAHFAKRRRAREVMGKGHKLWEDEIDGPRFATSDA